MRPRTPVAERVYRVLLRVYPREFRREYGDEMLRDAAELNDARRARGDGALLFAARLLGDLIRSALYQRAIATRDALRRSFDPEAGTTKGDSMDTLLQDIRYAIRALRARPAVTVVAALTLALGIGANTAIYSVVSAVLLRPLPYPSSDRLVTIWESTTANPQSISAYPDILDWKERNRSFDDIAIMRPISVNLTGVDTPDRLIGNFVSANLFPMLGARAQLGRLFTDAETAVGTAQPVVVLSNELWKTRFGGDRAILGRTLVLNAQPMTVIGVLAAGFSPPFGDVEAWLPVPMMSGAVALARGNPNYFAIARLRRGTTVDAAGRELKSLAHQLAVEYPTTNGGVGVTVVGLHEQLVGNVRPALITLLSAVGAVLLIACFNVANLQLARAAARRTEISVRAALGASRGRIVRQLLTESVLLAAGGGVLGVLLAMSSMKVLVSTMASTVPTFGAIHIDAPVLVFAMLITLATGVLFGLVPAVHSSRANLSDVLRVRGARGATLLGRVAIRDVLVVAQIALSTVLLVSAGLLARSLSALRGSNPGFDAANVVTMEFRLPSAKYRTPAASAAFMARATEEIRRVPGVTSAALVRGVPLSGNYGAANFIVEGQPLPTPDATPGALVNAATSQLFSTLHIPLLAGRDFDDTRDTPASIPVVIVNEMMARTQWPHASAIGQRVRAVGDSVWRSVIGVVGDVQQISIGDKPVAQIYTPYSQDPGIFATVVARVAHDPESFGAPVRAAIWAVDRDQPVWKIRTLDSLAERSVGQPRFTMMLVSAFAAVALVLAAVGIYGVMSYAVAQRTQEVGIRMALGARGVEVVRMILGRGMRLVGMAIAIGLGAALAVTRVLASQLHGVGPRDPITLVIVTAVLATVAGIAAWIPARRASRVDPVVALRHE